VQFPNDLGENISWNDLLNNMGSSFVISCLQLITLGYCPTAPSVSNVDIISITSCSETSISERTFKRLQSKSWKNYYHITGCRRLSFKWRCNDKVCRTSEVVCLWLTKICFDCIKSKENYIESKYVRRMYKMGGGGGGTSATSDCMYKLNIRAMPRTIVVFLSKIFKI
jgi:hypothetical protein